MLQALWKDDAIFGGMVIPLYKGKENVGRNFKEEKKAHPEMNDKQAIAIALNAAGMSRPGKKRIKKLS